MSEPSGDDVNEPEKKKLKKKIQKLVYHPPQIRQRWVTYAIAFTIVAINMMLLFFGTNNPSINFWWALAAIAMVTMFGVMILSAHHKHASDESQVKHSTGTMRRGLAASIVLVYLISFSAITFGPFEDKELSEEVNEEITNKIQKLFDDLKSKNEQSVSKDDVIELFNQEQQLVIQTAKDEIAKELQSQETILGHFTVMVGIVIAFYFGSKAVGDYKKKNDSSDSQITENSDNDLPLVSNDVARGLLKIVSDIVDDNKKQKWIDFVHKHSKSL